MRIQHNIPSMNAYRNFTSNSKSINKNLEKLSSGYKINRAGDDAAGLAISEKMRAQISGLEVAQKNAKDGISLIQTAEGALTEVHDMLNRMYKLAEQSANGTYDKTVDRQQLQKEIVSLRDEIDRISESANFNGISLLDGSQASGGAEGVEATLQTGDNTTMSSASLSNFTLDEGLTDEAVKAQVLAELTGGTITITGPDADNGEDWTSGGGATITGSGSLTFSGQLSLDANGTGTLTISASVDGNNVTVGTYEAAFAADANLDTAVFDLATASGGGGLKLQVGDTSDDYNQLYVSIDSVNSKSLGAYTVDGKTKTLREIGDLFTDADGEKRTVKGAYDAATQTYSDDEVMTISNIDISDQTGASDAMDVIKEAINYVSDTRGGLGALQNRLEHTINNLSVMQENMQDAESTIRDTDVAEEMMKYTKNNILVQSAQAMLAQANQLPQGVLQLLQ